LDLGLSSPQVDDPERGFSYRNNGPLDMRMNPTVGPTAAEWLIQVTQDDLANALRELGGERYAGRIARVIKESLPLDTTDLLTRAILKALTGKKSKKQHPARRSFQAIRMAVNRELEKLQSGLEDVLSLLAPGGRVVVLSFHSGEDRVVKNLFRENARNGHIKLLTKKPLICNDQEAEQNPRARSTKLRAAEKI
jgi:16S rRNA (cytosine1402-N4)-methyltransferase